MIMTIEQFEDAKQLARKYYRIWDDPFDTLMYYINEIEYEEGKELDKLKKSVVTCNLYKALNIFWTETLEDICDEKIKNYEKRLHFKELKKKYCTKDLDLLTDAEIENAWNTEVKTILEEHKIQFRKWRSDCPFCWSGRTWKTKFSFKNNLYNCFKCWEAWNSIWLYMKLTWIEFKQAVKNLNQF